MYNKLTICLIFILVLFSVSVFSQTKTIPETPAVSQNIPQQQVVDVISKIMNEQTKNTIEDINKHMDENFGQLDARMLENNKLLFRKAVFALLGGMTVVLVGYAFLVNRISKQYDINFYEKMIENKITALNEKLPSYLYLESVYKPVTFLDDRMKTKFETPKSYFDSLSKSQEFSREQYMRIKEDLFNDIKRFSMRQNQKKIIDDMQKGIKGIEDSSKAKFKWKKILYILIIILLIASAVAYFYFKYFRTTAVAGVA